MPLLQHVPYKVLQVVGTYLNVDDRYSFAETCLQACDAMDTDLVWYFPDEDEFVEEDTTGNNSNNISPTEKEEEESQMMLMRGMFSSSVSSSGGGMSSRQNSSFLLNNNNTNHNHNMTSSSSSPKPTKPKRPARFYKLSELFPTPLENPLPLDLSIRESDRKEQQELIFNILKEHNSLPKGFRFKCAAFKKFQFLVVNRLISRSCALLQHETRMNETVGDWSHFGMPASGSSVPRHQRYRDEMVDCVTRNDIDLAAKRLKLPQHIVQWLHGIEKHKNEIVMFMLQCDEMKAPAQIAGVMHFGSAAIYVYMGLMKLYMEGMLRFLSKFQWTREKLGRYISTLKIGKMSVDNFFSFPKIYSVTETQEVCNVLSSGDKNIASTANSVFQRLVAFNLHGGLLLLDPAYIAKYPHVISRGIPSIPVDVFAFGAFSFGCAAAFMGGRVPSLHCVHPRFARTVNLRWKLLYEFLRTTFQWPVEAFIFFVYSKAFDHVLPGLKDATLDASAYASSNVVAVRVSGVIGLLASRLIPERVRHVTLAAESLGRVVLKSALRDPLMKYVVTPISKAARTVYQHEFGGFNSAAAASLLTTGVMSVGIGLILESERPSFKRTVTRQRFRTFNTMLAHATFTAILSLLRWRMHAAGYGFWKSTAVEFSIRAGVSVVELFCARYNKFWKKAENEEEKKMQMRLRNTLEYDHQLDYWESDTDL